MDKLEFEQWPLIYAFIKITDVHDRAIGTKDLLNIQLRNDNLMVFDTAWEETSMAMEIEPDMAFLEVLYHRQ